MCSLSNFLDETEENFNEMGLIASNIEAAKRQIVDLKDFRNFVNPHMADVEQLNKMAGELLEDVLSNQEKKIRDAVKNIDACWKNRQSDLDKALLQLRQFQHAFNELLVWIAKIEKNLADNEQTYADSQTIEVKIANPKVIINNIHAHQTNVDQLNMVGKQLINSEFGSESVPSNRQKLNDLNNNVLMIEAICSVIIFVYHKILHKKFKTCYYGSMKSMLKYLSQNLLVAYQKLLVNS